MKRRTGFLTIFLSAIHPFLSLTNVNGQDTAYAKAIVSKLCSSQMHGRGYVKNGDYNAATFIKREYQKIGLTPLTDGYFQPFLISVNTFPGAMKLEINGKLLVAGRDYLIDPSSAGCKGMFEPCSISVNTLIKGSSDSILTSAKGKVMIIDVRKFPELSENDKARINGYRKMLSSGINAQVKAVIELTNEKLTFGISPVAYSIPYLRVSAAACPDTISTVTINIRNHLLNQYESRNVAGYIRGSVCPDSMLVFTAHYDHLGLMGRQTYFPGADDNASGIAMLLTLAKHFKTNPPRCSVAFLAFSGEELGLLGSKFFTDYPLVNLSKIRFLINLDLVGNGTKGITVVNGSVYPDFFNTLVTINDNEKLLPVVKKRGEACISDHCPFYRKGVPDFFIYTMGGSPAYHDIIDKPEALDYNGFEGLTKLLMEFAKKF
jgi:aminopeptidase YwaD